MSTATVARIPWPGDDRFLVAEDGTIVGPSGRQLTPFPDRDGYLRINVYRAGERWQVFVHTLVAETWLGDRPAGQQVLHRDGDFANPAASNLRYGTQAENEADKITHDRRAWGVRHGMHRLTEDDVRAIRASGENCAALATRYGVSETHVGRIRARVNWRHI